MSIVKRLLLAALVLLCNACAAPGMAEIKRENLPTVAVAQELVLREAVSTVSLVGGFNFRLENGAYPALYTAEREDEGGTYFFATHRTIWTRHEADSKTFIRLGGFYLPRNAEEGPRLFYVYETQAPELIGGRYIENGTPMQVATTYGERPQASMAETSEAAESRLTEAPVVIPVYVPGPISPMAAGVGGAIGNALGGAIVNSIERGKVGKLMVLSPIDDKEIRARLLASVRKDERR